MTTVGQVHPWIGIVGGIFIIMALIIMFLAMFVQAGDTHDDDEW